jgi:hypothetical protein
VRIRITKPPDPEEFAEFDVHLFRAGEVFDLSPQFATLLILAGNAEPVTSSAERSEAADSPSQWKKERKQFS